MRAFLVPLLLVAFVVADAPVADAQIGRLLNRAREAVTGDAREAAEDTARRATRTGPAPAMDLGGLLDTHFYAERSEFRFSDPGNHFLLFPPSGFDPYDIDGSYVVRDADDRVVGSDRMGNGSITDSPAIAVVEARGGMATITETGDYTFEVILGGETIAAFPFTATVEASDDPFATGGNTRVDGPWQTHGYFADELDQADSPLTFHTWVSQNESRVEVSIRRDGQEVAFGVGGFSGGSYLALAHSRMELLTPGSRDVAAGFGRVGRDPHNWTIEDVTPGTYEVVLSTESGGPFRTFTIDGADGTFVPHVRSDSAIEPRALYLAPRKMGGQLLNKPVQMFWVGPETW